MNRRSVGLVILTAWAAALAWLAVREQGGGGTAHAGEGLRRLAPISTYYRVLLGATQVGVVNATLDTTSVGYTLLETTLLDLPAAPGTPSRQALNLRAEYSRGFRLRSASVTVSDAAGDGTLNLEYLPGDRLASIRRGGMPRAVLALPSTDVSAEPALAFRLATLRAVRGGSLDSVLLLEAGGGAWHRVRGTVGRDSVGAVSDSAMRDQQGRWQAANVLPERVWDVTWEGPGALPLRGWVTADGRVLAREAAFGLRLEAAPYEVSHASLRSPTDPPTDGPALTGARWLSLAPVEPAATALVRAVVRRWDGPAWPGSAAALAGGRQSVSGDTVTIGPAAPEPYPGDPAPDLAQSQFPGVRQGLEAMLANAMAAPGADADTIAALARYLGATRRETGTGPVLEFVALAQLAGYLARAVHGVDVRRDGLPAHRWAEVWRDGWMAVDPARGQAPASTTLLRLGTGLPTGLVELVTRYGGLRLTEPR